MSGNSSLFNFHWDVDKYKPNFDPEYWGLCRSFMVIHKTKYPEQRLVHLTEAFYQIGVYGSSYDPKTTRMVSVLAMDVLDVFLDAHPGALRHPFKKSAIVVPENNSSVSKGDDGDKYTNPSSIWDGSVDKSIIVNIMVQNQLEELLKGFVIIYDIRQVSTMNDNKISILHESFKRSKFGPFLWDKVDTHNNICPIRLSLKWKGTILAEAVGADDSPLKTRLAQAVLSKIANFSPGIEAKWSYYRDGRMPDHFDHPDPKKNNIYKIMPRSQFKAMAEITSFIDTFANSDSFAEIVFGMDFSCQEKSQITEYINKSWGNKLTYRTVKKMGVKSKGETHVCMYHIHSGEEMKRWMEGCGGENERYRMVPPGSHRRAGACDDNVREVLTVQSEVSTNKEEAEDSSVEVQKSEAQAKEVSSVSPQTVKEENEERNKNPVVNEVELKKSENYPTKVSDPTGKSGVGTEDDLEKLLDGFVLFYDAKRNSEIDKDDWFSALCESFKLSKFGPLEVINEVIRPLRMRCTFKWNNMTLASAEGLTETQAKTAATLQLISKLEPFTYIIQAKEDYFFNGKVPPFIENPDTSKSNICRVVKRKDLPSYYSIFQTVDEFVKKRSNGELVFGADFTWELKNEIVVYLKAKGLDYRYFTQNDQKPWSHMAVYHSVDPEELKNYLLKNGGENEKYKLIPPQKAELTTDVTAEVELPKDTDKGVIKSPVKVDEKRKLPEKKKEPSPPLEVEGNKIQIKLKKFKKDDVDYPEDTGGDFPGLILWVFIKKNSMCQRNVFCILVDSFKLSKYGELLVEESEENVWSRKEPFKKCVIKSNRKVLSVGMGDTKTEAKISACLQVLRQLRQHCYTIQAKESYYKEGKATPYDFNPDPAKEHVYKLAKRNTFRDRASIIKFVDDFSKKSCSEEVIFGDDFSHEEREYILHHCRQISLSYRLMKCQSIVKGMHSHIAIYHQLPPPVIKAALVKAGGETDMFRLISPGGKICCKSSQNDLWPETLEKEESPNKINQNLTPNSMSATGKPIENFPNNPVPNSTIIENVEKNKLEVQADKLESGAMSTTSDQTSQNRDQLSQATQLPHKENLNSQNTVVIVETQSSSIQHFLPGGAQGPLHDVPLGPHPMNYDGPDGMQQMNFLPVTVGSSTQIQLPYVGQSLQEMPLVFGPQPPVEYLVLRPGDVIFQPNEIHPNNAFLEVPQPADNVEMSNREVSQLVTNSPKPEVDLREELAMKRQTENRQRKVRDVSTDRKVIKNYERGNWSRKVFVAQQKDQNKSSIEKTHDLRERLRHRDLSKDIRGRNMISDERILHRVSPRRDQRRGFQERDRISPGRYGRRISPERNLRRLSPERGHIRMSPGRNHHWSRERYRSSDRLSEERIVRRRESSYERRISHSPRRNISEDRRRSRSPFRQEKRLYRASPETHFRDLWDNVGDLFSQNIFMHKYVKQDSTTEADPFALLRSTRSPNFNVDFDFITSQIGLDEWQVSVELITDNDNTHPLVGEGTASTEHKARLIAAYHAIDTVQKSCRVIEPNFGYFADGGVPEFLIRRNPMKTSIYEIMQNMDPMEPLNRYKVELMFSMFIQSQLEDLFFLASDFSHMERVLVIDVSNQMNLGWRLFGLRHPDARPDDVVSTQHVCICKPKTLLQLVQELLELGGSSHKYTLVDPRESRITRFRNWPGREFLR